MVLVVLVGISEVGSDNLTLRINIIHHHTAQGHALPILARLSMATGDVNYFSIYIDKTHRILEGIAYSPRSKMSTVVT